MMKRSSHSLSSVRHSTVSDRAITLAVLRSVFISALIAAYWLSEGNSSPVRRSSLQSPDPGCLPPRRLSSWSLEPAEDRHYGTLASDWGGAKGSHPQGNSVCTLPWPDGFYKEDWCPWLSSNKGPWVCDLSLSQDVEGISGGALADDVLAPGEVLLVVGHCRFTFVSRQNSQVPVRPPACQSLLGRGMRGGEPAVRRKRGKEEREVGEQRKEGRTEEGTREGGRNK